MTPLTTLRIAWAIFAAIVLAAVVGFGLLARLAAATAPADATPIAGFSCNEKGLCVTTVDQVRVIAFLWNAMARDLAECRSAPPAVPSREKERVTWN